MLTSCLHLLTLSGVRTCACDWPGGISLSQVVLLRDKIYFGVTCRGFGRSGRSTGKLHYSSITHLSSWTSLAVPGVIKFVGTYRSHLVLVGGVNYAGKVWVMCG